MNTNSLDFLRQTAPFSALPPNEQEQLAARCMQRTYAADTLIYRPGSKLRELSLIVVGQVEKYFVEADGTRAHTEVFGVGDSFGAISIMLNNRTALRYVRTTAKTLLIQVPDVEFLRLTTQYEAFAAFFTEQFSQRMMRHGYAAHLLHPVDPDLRDWDLNDNGFRQTVGAFISRDLHTLPQSATVQEAARQMTQNSRGYCLIVDPEGRPLGMITDRTLRNEIVAEGLSPLTLVSQVMSKPLLTIPSEALAYEAILQMLRYGVKRLLVTERGEITGIVSLKELQNEQERSPYLFLQELHQEILPVDELGRRWKRTPRIVQQLLDRGVRPEAVNRLVTSISDGITSNIIRAGIEQLGQPPTRFSFVVMGSAGRREQTLATDQDNALIYDDVESERRSEVRSYFLELGTFVADRLNEAGFAYCDGKLMASNSKWTHSLSHWQDNYRQWIDEPFADQVLKVSTFFDMRSVFGDRSLVDALKGHVFRLLSEQPNELFFSRLANISLEIKPPLSLLGQLNFHTNSEGEKVIDIKQGMMPLADFARILALQHHVTATSTADRLDQLQRLGAISPESYHELQQAYFFLMRLRLTHQAQEIVGGKRPADNEIESDALSQLERYTLKHLFKIVQRYQSRLRVEFTGVLR